MSTDKKIQDFILQIIQDRVSFGGLVSFSHLKVFGIEAEFAAYCQKHGCTLSVSEGNSVAPWADFRAFLMGKHPDD